MMNGEEVGVEVVGVPVRSGSRRKRKGQFTKTHDNKISSSAIESSSSYLMPHTEARDHVVEISLQGIQPAPSATPRLPKVRHPAGTLLESSSAVIPDVRPAYRKRDDPAAPITHISGDPFPTTFRVVGLSPTPLSDEQQLLNIDGHCYVDDPVSTFDKYNSYSLGTKGLAVPTTINTSMNLTSSTTLTDEQDADEDEENHFHKTRDKFLQLDLSNLDKTKKERTLSVKEIFHDEETGPDRSNGNRSNRHKDRDVNASTDSVSHQSKTTTRDYLRIAQQLLQKRKERERQEEKRRQRNERLPPIPSGSPFLPWSRPKSRLGYVWVCLVVTLGIVIVLIALAVSQSGVFRKDDSANTNSALQDISPGFDIDASTATPDSSASPIQVTAIPSTSTILDVNDEEMQHFGPLLLSDFPQSTQLILSKDDQNSPVVKAYQWLLDDPAVGSYPKWQQFQRMALATLYYSTNGPQWKQTNEWLSYELSECQWYPQACDDNGRIRRLLLSDTNLSGSLPAELFWLTSLRQLQLFENPLLGGSLPTEVGLLKELEVLWLQKCSLVGPLPTEIGSIKKLVYLDISSNPLGQRNQTQDTAKENSGLATLSEARDAGNRRMNDLPTELGMLTNLQELILSNAGLSGTIPSELGLLTQLRYSLQLDGNALHGTVPDQLGNLRDLENFYAHENELSGTIPNTFSSWSKIQIIDLSVNHLVGPMPTEWAPQMAVIEELWLYDNLLTGLLPSSLGQMSNSITSLDMSMNQFSSFPTEICQLTLLSGLWIYQNNIGGELPSCLGNLENLVQLSLFSNRLSGYIPSELAGLSNLRGLWMDGNNLSGRIPTDLLLSTSMMVLHLFSNKLRGSLPDFPSQPYYALQELRLNNNQLTSTLPPSLANLHSSLERLHIYQNEISGYIPSEMAMMTKLSELVLHYNELTGAVPDELCELKDYSDVLSIRVDCDVSCDCCVCV